jgi:4-hydroxybenzoate polyprenyltransferase
MNTLPAPEVELSVRPPATWRDYVRIMRLDHATKHIFVLPGIILALLLRGPYVHLSVWPFIAGLICAVTIASANYVINEYLDRESDAHHPEKSKRMAVSREMRGSTVALLWFCLVAVGLATAAITSKSMFLICVVFAAQGIVYNVKPLRSKDVPYLDVISESINNPLRLLIGWAMVDSTTLPPSSVIIAYWLTGAFLMATKRLSEYREIVASHGTALLVAYRKSFAGYNEQSLTASCLVYALIGAMALSIFFVKYRIEYIFTLPFIAFLFGAYMSMSMLPGSTAQKPEKLFNERGLISLVIIISVIFGVFTFVNVPALETLTGQHFITLD